jgi:hypothetical protein
MPMTNDVLACLREVRTRWRSATGIRRAVLLLGVVGMITGAGLLTAGFAVAGVGSQPGDLTLSPASGPVTKVPTYQTTIGCPSGFQASAQLSEFNTDGSYGSIIADGVASPTAAFSGALEFPVGSALSLGTNVGNGQTSEWAMGCYSGAAESGSVEYVMSTFVTLSADGTTYTSGSTPGAGPTTTTTSTSTSASASATVSSSPTDSSSASPSDSSSASPSDSSSASPSTSASSTASATPSPSTTLPSGAPQTGAGGATLPGDGNNVLIALGVVALAASAAAIGVALRGRRERTAEDGPGHTDADGY